MVHVHFCEVCGTKLWLSFERFEGVVGIYAGTFDDPCWFGIAPETSKHIFLDMARRDTVIPAGLPTFGEHATDTDGVAQKMTVFEAPRVLGDT